MQDLILPLLETDISEKQEDVQLIEQEISLIAEKVQNTLVQRLQDTGPNQGGQEPAGGGVGQQQGNQERNVTDLPT